MLFQRWMRFGILSSALVAIPAQNAFASGAQWRPVNSVSPAAHSAEARMLRSASAAHARFRPVNHLRQPQALPQLAAPVTPRPPVRPVAPQPPAFARQFSWRPAPTRWARHENPQNVRYARNVSSRSVRSGMNAGDWRPVAGSISDSGTVGGTSSYASQGGWRPVAEYGSARQPATNPGYAYGAPMTRPAYPQPMPYSYAPRNRHVNPYPRQPYMMPPMPLAGFNPYPAPYAPAPFAAPYGGYRAMLPPPPPVWGWQPPVYMPARPLYGPPPMPGLNNESSLAGCPGC